MQQSQRSKVRATKWGEWVGLFAPRRDRVYECYSAYERDRECMSSSFPHMRERAPWLAVWQTIRKFFNIWPFAAVKIVPILSQICQSKLSILPNKKQTFKILPKTCNPLPKWRNFAKSGHTVHERLRERLKEWRPPKRNTEWPSSLNAMIPLAVA